MEEVIIYVAVAGVGMNRLQNHSEEDEGVMLQEAPAALKQPSQYHVLLLNDDYTPMEFVVEVLERFFSMNREQATRIMLQVHTEGKAICGIFTREIAETKVSRVNEYARNYQHPLLCTMDVI